MAQKEENEIITKACSVCEEAFPTSELTHEWIGIRQHIYCKLCQTIPDKDKRLFIKTNDQKKLQTIYLSELKRKAQIN